MAEYQLKLPSFEGPLELLLHLLEKNKVDIYDIPIAMITRQYLQYLQNMQAFDIEVASEFIGMATFLLQIKTKMLLPQNKNLVTADEENLESLDPRDLLVDKLVEYKRFQQCAQQLNELLQRRNKLTGRKESDLVLKTTRLQQCQASKLFGSLQNMLEFSKQEEVVRYIDVAELSIKDAMKNLLKLLKQSQKPLAFASLLTTAGREQMVIYFLAILELLKQNKLAVTQEDIFAPIFILSKEDAKC